ncbi:type III secretion system cytoplasmic ring protein SctQ [Plastoroseomonas hellenica]|uniref:type III secretion system cytoplasmic ring protein SctQ n=1 Tax=Plastoroseomonas hellenica TaxID=2687306 RepID=UPI001BAA0552|nr:type III secretion system cytoplasmic ring protein SctQ [Plastoroseomonas hellenica]MBR0647780.1 YscQ/HrcQ family type III secretion apparatus protein [Plastoroseomonas hellenica]
MDGLTPPPVSRWRAPALTPYAMRAANRLARRRAPVMLPGGLSLRPAAPGAASGAVLTLDSAEGPLRIQAPDAAWDALLATLDPAAVGARGALGALFAEAALELVLVPLESGLGPLAARDFGAGKARPDLGFALADGSRVALELPAPLLAAAIELLGALPAEPALPPVPIPVSLRIAMADLPRAALATLRPGDAILLSALRPRRHEAVAVAAESLAWPVRLDERARAAGPRRRAAALGLQEWTMSEQQPADELPLDEIPIRLAFEVGRAEMSLAELGAVGEGHIFPLGRDPLAGPVDILANGRRIGQGELVEVGGTLAVRVLSLLRG